MFHIHNDYVEKENPYPSKKLKRQVYGSQRARAKGKTLENITNVVNKNSKRKIQGKKINATAKTSTNSHKSIKKKQK